MQQGNKRALVIDLSYLVHRCLAVPTMAELRTKDKARVGGIYGVLKSLQAALSKDVYTKVVCCMDSYPAFRKQLFPSYKASRRNNPDSPEYQSYIAKDKWGWSQKSTQDFTFNTLKSLLPKLKIQTIIQENVEGDDLVYHTCLHLTKEGWYCTAMSDDKDYLQLINLVPSLKIYRAMKGDVITKENFFDKIGVHPEFFILYKALLGDPSDEIPGVAKGFGEGSIIKFVNYAHDAGLNPNDISIYDKMFELAESVEDKKLTRYLKNFNRDCFNSWRKNMKLMDFRECPYGLNKREELKETLEKPLSLDVECVNEVLKTLEMNSMLTLPISPMISRLT